MTDSTKELRNSVARLRTTIEASRFRGMNNAHRSADAAILQLAAGMGDASCDGLVGPDTVRHVRRLLAENWSCASGFTPPGPVYQKSVTDALAQVYAQLDRFFDFMSLTSGRGTRDPNLALVQVLLGLEPTGLLGDATREAVESFLAKHWMGSSPLPAIL